MYRLLLTGLMISLGCTGDKDIIENPENQNIYDGDGDGYGYDEDCNDFDASISPNASELCDNLDNNCDGQIDEGVLSVYYLDADGDGFGDAEASIESCEITSRYVSNGNDCDDSNIDVYPAAPELCDAIDNDCNGEIDDGMGDAWFEDADFDGYGNPDVVVNGCFPGPGYVDNATDCNDLSFMVHPDQPEICDELDNNCDGIIDEGVTTTYYLDSDSDGYGDPLSILEACSYPVGYVLDNTDCDDSQLVVRPGGIEICDELDNNCDGQIDEGVLLSFYPDADFDGYGDPSQEVMACEAPISHVDNAQDCDDAQGSVNPDGLEVCNNTDDNCDSTIDEGFLNAGIYDQIDNCGSCGTDCTQNSYDNATPICDVDTGTGVCDFICDSSFFDVNGDASDGCECSYISAVDTPFDGIDADCDGNDGDHLDAVHVSSANGSDTNDGSLGLPVQTIAQGLFLAQAEGKSYVLVASGSYQESVVLEDGLTVYGSMSESFDERDTVISTYLIGNAGSPALSISNVTQGALWSNFSIEGYADSSASSSAVAVFIQDSDENLILSNNMILSGAGRSGLDGLSGGGGQEGEFGEDGSFGGTGTCNTAYVGGGGGLRTCGTQDVSGGDGATNICPVYNQSQPTGADGLGDAPGIGGIGGCDARLNNSAIGCICNLAPSSCYGSGEIGIDGGSGLDGSGGIGSTTTGSWNGNSWTVSFGQDGLSASNGSGGGGGGVGSGAQLNGGSCGSFHHIGGAGGGGGAGGCGGEGGLGGQGGGSSFGIFYVCTSTCSTLPTITDNEIQSGDAGAGGNGGDGGLGGLGGEGGLAGDSNDPDPNSQTTAWCNNEGGAGGDGGNGGDGGGGGGGAGGNSYSAYVIGTIPTSSWLSAYNDLDAGLAGLGGRGGRGGTQSNDGGDGINGEYNEQNWP